MKKECSIIRDMLPLYFENMVSEDTAEFVKKHIENCPDCAAELKAMKSGKEISETEPSKRESDAKVKMKKARDPAVHGKQSVKQLLGQNQGATNVEIDKESIRDFEKLAKKYGVDFAVRKDKSVDPPRFLVFVRSKDADALDAICKEHQARALTKNEKPSVLAQLKKFKEIVAAIPKKVREKKQERDL
jgi:hypothetical protein